MQTSMSLPTDPFHLRPSFLEIDLDALAENVQTIRQRFPGTPLMAVIKANAYGHGLVPCARLLEYSGVESLSVALLEEGIALRNAGIRIPILVMGGVVGTQIEYFLEYNLEIAASSSEKLRRIDEAAARSGKRAVVHLKIDTGMERLGTHYYSCAEHLALASSARHCEVKGIFSHFATVKDGNAEFGKVQLERFLDVCEQFEKLAGYRPIRHIANSSGILVLPESGLDMIRPGILLYGVFPAMSMMGAMPLKPVMSLKTQVVFFKVVKRGAGVSYGHTWTAPEDTRVVTLPVGYGDGYPRRLSNKGSVLLRGKRYPVRGVICMDQVMVEVGKGEAYNGDEVVLIGQQGGDAVSVNEIASLIETTPHEIMVSTNIRLPRRYQWKGASYFEADLENAFRKDR